MTCRGKAVDRLEAVTTKARVRRSSMGFCGEPASRRLAGEATRNFEEWNVGGQQ